MAERKSLGLLKKKDVKLLGKSLEDRKPGNNIDVSSNSFFTLEEMKKLIKSLGGDTEWIEKIPSRERELKEKISNLEEEIEKYRDELYKLGLLKKALGI